MIQERVKLEGVSLDSDWQFVGKYHFAVSAAVDEMKRNIVVASIEKISGIGSMAYWILWYTIQICKHLLNHSWLIFKLCLLH